MVKARAASEKRTRASTARQGCPHGEAIGAEAAVASPAIILVKPQLGENIGFAARAMANFGLTDLRLVAPRDGWPNDKAHAAAAGAAFVVDQATVYDSVERAIGELNFVLASTARPREMVKAVLSPESAATELRRRGGKAERTGVLFGPERSGLDNDAIALADAILTAPVSPGFASLSLPQAVLLFGYEWLKAESAAPAARTRHRLRRARRRGHRLYRHEASDAGGAARPVQASRRANSIRPGFLYPPEKRPSMVRAIRNMFHRMGATEQDVRTWRGIVAALSGQRSGRGKKGVIVPPRFSYCDGL